MTWSPIWMKANQIMIAPLAIPSLSYGLFAYVVYGGHNKEVMQGSSLENLEEDKKEMRRWSHTLCDPESSNYNDFTLHVSHQK